MLNKELLTGDMPVLAAVDPGTTTVGLAFAKWDVFTGTLTVYEAYTVDISNRVSQHEGFKYNAAEKGLLKLKCEVLRAKLSDDFLEHQPAILYAESPFTHISVTTYNALIEANAAILGACEDVCGTTQRVYYAPQEVKKCTGAIKHSKGKEGVLQSLVRIKNDDNGFEIGVDLFDLDEHSLDAVSVMYTAYKKHIAGA